MSLFHRRVRREHVVAVRAGSGYVHLGVPTGRGYDTMCCSTIVSEHTRIAAGADMVPYWRAKARYQCPDCKVLAARPWSKVRQITGW